MVEQVVGLRFVVEGEREAEQAIKDVSRSQDNLSRNILKGTQVAQRLERQYRMLDKAFNTGKISAQQYANAIQYVDKQIAEAYAGNIEYERSIRRTTDAMKKQSDANHFASGRMNAMGVVTQQAGYQVGDFLVQVQSGTNAFVAFGQQATQLVGILPLMAESLGVSAGKLIAISSILGVLIPLATAFAAAISRTGGSEKIFNDLQYAIEPIKPLIDALSYAMNIASNAAIDFANLLVNNLDRVLLAATLVSGFFAAKWVAAFVAARITTFSLIGALKLLRGAIIRTGIGAIVLGAIELVYQFNKLVKSVGGFGNAMTLLGEVAAGVWEGIKESAKGIVPALKSVFMDIKASFLSMVSDVAYEWNRFLTSVIVGLPPSTPPGVVRSVSEAARSAADAYVEFQKASDKAAASAKNLRDEASSFGEEGFETALKAMNKLRDAMKEADTEGRSIDIRDWFGGAEGDGEGNGGKGYDALTELQNRVQSIADTIKTSMSEAFMSMVEGTKSTKDAFRDMARAIIKQLFEVIVVQRIVGSFDAKTGVGSGIVGAVMNLFPAANGAAFQGGNVVPFANGGVVGGPTTFPMSGGRTGLMGEAGPEAIMPLKRGKDGKLGVVAEGGGAVNITQNFNISANGDDSVKRIVQQQIPRIAEATKAAVVDAKRRGGAYGKAFA